MSCRELVELVTDYIEGALPDDRADTVRAHLLECVDCLRYAGQLQLVARLLGRFTEEAAS